MARPDLRHHTDCHGAAVVDVINPDRAGRLYPLSPFGAASRQVVRVRFKTTPTASAAPLLLRPVAGLIRNPRFVMGLSWRSVATGDGGCQRSCRLQNGWSDGGLRDRPQDENRPWSGPGAKRVHARRPALGLGIIAEIEYICTEQEKFNGRGDGAECRARGLPQAVSSKAYG